MADEIPRGPDGLRGCEWCGGPIQQPATGRRRRYCRPGHREMAYRARKADSRVTDALQWDLDTARAWLEGHGITVAVPPPATVPTPAREECPYCRQLTEPGTGLVSHLRVCPDGPGFIN